MNHRPSRQVVISLDVTAPEFGKNSVYRLALDNTEMIRDALNEMIRGWLKRCPVVSIKDLAPTMALQVYGHLRNVTVIECE